MMAEPNVVIGVSPAQLLFGSAIQLDRGIFLSQLPASGVDAEVAFSDLADRILSAQRLLLDTAQRLQKQQDMAHMEQVDGVPIRHVLTLAHMCWCLTILRRWVDVLRRSFILG
jgi:hypothetical protein